MKHKTISAHPRVSAISLGFAVLLLASAETSASAAPESTQKGSTLTSPTMSRVASPIVVPNLTTSEFENTFDFGFWLGGVTYYPGSEEYITLFKQAFPLKGVIITDFANLNARYTTDALSLLKRKGVQSVIQSTPSSIQTLPDSRFQYEVAGVSNGSNFRASPPLCYSTLGATSIAGSPPTPDSASCNAQLACTMAPVAGVPNCCEPASNDTALGSCILFGGSTSTGNGNVAITDSYYTSRVNALAGKAAPDTNAFGSSMADMYLPFRALHQGLPGYSSLSVAAFRNDLQGTDEGLTVKYPSTGNVSFVMKFSDYAFRYLGRYPKDAFPQYCPGGTCNWSTWVPPSPESQGVINLTKFYNINTSPLGRKPYPDNTLFDLLKNYEWLRFQQARAKYASTLRSTNPLVYQIITNPEGMGIGTDLKFLSRLDTPVMWATEYFSTLSGADAAYTFGRVLNTDRSSKVKRGVSVEIGDGGQSTNVYFAPPNAYLHAYAISSSISANFLESDFLETSPDGGYALSSLQANCTGTPDYVNNASCKVYRGLLNNYSYGLGYSDAKADDFVPVLPTVKAVISRNLIRPEADFFNPVELNLDGAGAKMLAAARDAGYWFDVTGEDAELSSFFSTSASQPSVLMYEPKYPLEAGWNATLTWLTNFAGSTSSPTAQVITHAGVWMKGDRFVDVCGTSPNQYLCESGQDGYMLGLSYGLVPVPSDVKIRSGYESDSKYCPAGAVITVDGFSGSFTLEQPLLTWQFQSPATYGWTAVARCSFTDSNGSQTIPIISRKQKGTAGFINMIHVDPEVAGRYNPYGVPGIPQSSPYSNDTQRIAATKAFRYIVSSLLQSLKTLPLVASGGDKVSVQLFKHKTLDLKAMVVRVKDFSPIGSEKNWEAPGQRIDFRVNPCLLGASSRQCSGETYFSYATLYNALDLLAEGAFDAQGNLVRERGVFPDGTTGTMDLSLFNGYYDVIYFTPNTNINTSWWQALRNRSDSRRNITAADKNAALFPPSPSQGVPFLSSFAPSNAPIGTSVTITGNNFTGATSVKINGLAAAFVVNSNTQISATVPSGATTGLISITTPSGTTTSSTTLLVPGDYSVVTEDASLLVQQNFYQYYSGYPAPVVSPTGSPRNPNNRYLPIPANRDVTVNCFTGQSTCPTQP
jgi:IPT/TIG domain